MPKWEYKLVESETGTYRGQDCTSPFINYLNKLGKEGWEAVGMGMDKIVSFTRPVTVLLKRPID